MGLYAFEIAQLASLRLPKPFKAVSFGHPDILATPDELEPVFNRRLKRDPDGVIQSRGAHAVNPEIVGNARIVIGGYIYHMVPLCHWNHGFWNFSPCVFSDFYEQNGFEVVSLMAEYREKLTPVATKKKFQIANNGRKLNLMCIAKRVEGVAIEFPIQYKWPPRER